VEYEKSPPGSAVTVPSTFVGVSRVTDVGPRPPQRQSNLAMEMRLRFQLPPAVLPLKVERARFFANVKAPSRRVSVAGHADGRDVPLHQVESPLDPIRVEITGDRLLQLDADGGLHVTLAVGERRGAGAGEWALDGLGLEVVGRTGPAAK
jgi:hypothetical protein